MDNICRKKKVKKIVDRDIIFNFPNPKNISDTALIKFENVNFSYISSELLFNNISFGIYQDSKIGLIGPNGVGKSSILSLITQKIYPNQGNIIINKHVKISHFSQHNIDNLNMDKTPVEELQYNNDFAIKDIRQHLGSFGINGNIALQKISTLSGGQKTRVSFSKMALNYPNILLLDEPTNHLDINAINSIIKGLNKYTGGYIIISHNQKILEECCNQLWIISGDGNLNIFEGSFTDYKQSIIDQMSL